MIQITRTNICGSDLHMYEGRTDMDTGRVLGHENMGRVVEVGPAVEKVKVGDMVCVPFNVACGHCRNCERGLHELLPGRQPRPADRRRCLRVRGYGPVERRAGGIPAGAVGRLQLPAAARGRHGQAERLRHGRRHLPDRVSRDRDGERRTGRLRGDLRRRSGRADGGLLGDPQERPQGHGGRSPPRPAGAGREDRRDPDRRLEGISRSSRSWS